MMLSGYECGLYRELYADWDVVQCEAMADGAKPRTEFLWMNSAAMEARANAGTLPLDLQ